MTAPVLPGDPAPVIILCADYDINLPQSTNQVNNSLGNLYQLMTWHGAADSATQVLDNFLWPCLQDSPILLVTAIFNLPGIVCTSSNKINGEIKHKILHLAFNRICITLFRNLCPHYTDQPYTAIKVIKQSYIDTDVNCISTGVWAYHHCMTIPWQSGVSCQRVQQVYGRVGPPHQDVLSGLLF